MKIKTLIVKFEFNKMRDNAFVKDLIEDIKYQWDSMAQLRFFISIYKALKENE